LKIIHKLLVGYAAFLAIALFFGLYVYNNIGHIQVKQKLVEVADDARDDVLELRRNEKNYVIRRDPEYIKKIHDITGTLRALFENLEPEIVNAFGRDDFSRLSGSLATYAKLMDSFDVYYREEAGLAGGFREAGRDLEQEVFKMRDTRPARDILEIRLNEKNYLLFKDPEYIERLKKGVASLKAGLKSDRARSLCDSYLAIADKLAHSGGRERALLTRVQDTGKQVQDIIEQVARREREEIGVYLRSSQELLLGALFAMGIMGPLLMFFMARAITAPIISLETVARKISEGDEDVRVKVGGDIETASLQRSFNVMMNKIQTSRESLEDTIRLLHDKNAMLIESEKLASIGVLASGVAHEINNPLANILLTAEAMEEAGADIPDKDREVFVHDIIEQTERARIVVGNLLSYARAMKEDRPAELDVRESVRRSVKLLAHHISLHDATLDEYYCDSPMVVTANSGRLEQVFVNIILNALHAMKKGGAITLTVRPDREAGLALVEIKDTGPGIPPSAMQKIFDPFFTTKPLGEGTGLGLYISFGIVHDHGGDIEVESELGEGALFRVRLPLAKG